MCPGGRNNVVLIGSAPSSGSTMLADVVDSFSMAACGPELEFFGNPALYDFERFKSDPHLKGSLFSLGTTGLFPRYDRLDAYGLNKAEFLEMVRSSNTLDELVHRFRTSYLKFRGMDADGWLFEKTPQNVNAMGEWLRSDASHRFIFLVRDPLYVFNSLLNRGWSAYTAGATWLLYAAKAWNALESTQVELLQLEQFVKHPFEVMGELAGKIHPSLSESPEDLKAAYEENAYRIRHSKKKSSWEANTAERKIIDPNQKEIPHQVRTLFHGFLTQAVHPKFARRFGLSEITYLDAVKRFGYDQYLDPALQKTAVVSRPSLKDQKRFAIKTARSMVQGHGQVSDFGLYNAALVSSQ